MPPKTRRVQKKGTRKVRGGKVLDVRSPKDVKAFERLIVNGPLTFVYVNAKWCGACHQFSDKVWSSLTKLKNKGMNLASVDSEMIGKTSLANVPRKFYPTLMLVGKDKKPATFLDEEGNPTAAMPRNASLEEDKEAFTSLVQNPSLPVNSMKTVNSPESPMKMVNSPESPMKMVNTPESPMKMVNSPESPMKSMNSPESPMKSMNSPELSMKSMNTPESPMISMNSPESPMNTPEPMSPMNSMKNTPELSMSPMNSMKNTAELSMSPMNSMKNTPELSMSPMNSMKNTPEPPMNSMKNSTMTNSMKNSTMSNSMKNSMTRSNMKNLRSNYGKNTLKNRNSLPPEAIASRSPFPNRSSSPSLKRAPVVPDIGADLVASQRVLTKGGSLLKAMKDHTASLKAMLKLRSNTVMF